MPVGGSFRIPLTSVVLLTSLTPFIARGQDDRVEIDRLRLEIVPVEEERSFFKTIVHVSQLLKLYAGGLISPKPGKKFRVTAVAYSPTVDQNDLTPCITASGARVGPDVVATNFLPFGTRLRIDGKTYVVRDRMNQKYNRQYIIDIWHPTRQQALAFGRRTVEIEILGVAPAVAKESDVPEEETPPPTPTLAEPPAEQPPQGVLGELRESIQKLGVLFQRFTSLRALPKDVDCLSTDGE
jgi:3D (Asp-Asp-Asp) domain-containing protein